MLPETFREKEKKKESKTEGKSNETASYNLGANTRTAREPKRETKSGAFRFSVTNG